MDIIRGMAANPIILFFSGDDCMVAEEKPFMRHGIQFSRLALALPPHVMWRYNIRPEYLDDSISNFPEGVLWKAFPSHAIIKISDNPIAPRWICLYNFDGTILNSKSVSLEWLRTMVDNTTNLIQENSMYKQNVTVLRRDLMTFANFYAKYKKRLAPLLDTSKEAAELFGEINRVIGRVKI